MSAAKTQISAKDAVIFMMSFKKQQNIGLHIFTVATLWWVFLVQVKYAILFWYV